MIFVPRQHRIGAARATRNRAGPPKRPNPKGRSGPCGLAPRKEAYRAVPGLQGRRAPWPPEAVSLLSEAFVQTRMPEENEVDHRMRPDYAALLRVAALDENWHITDSPPSTTVNRRRNEGPLLQPGAFPNDDIRACNVE